jgi:hypothetical protein
MRCWTSCDRTQCPSHALLDELRSTPGGASYYRKSFSCVPFQMEIARPFFSLIVLSADSEVAAHLAHNTAIPDPAHPELEVNHGAMHTFFRLFANLEQTTETTGAAYRRIYGDGSAIADRMTSTMNQTGMPFNTCQDRCGFTFTDSPTGPA